MGVNAPARTVRLLCFFFLADVNLVLQCLVAYSLQHTVLYGLSYDIC